MTSTLPTENNHSGSPATAVPAQVGSFHPQEQKQNAPADAPRVIIIGAGSRGNAYARPIHASGLAQIVAVAEPLASQRHTFGRQYIWGPAAASPAPHEAFPSWEAYVAYETQRRARVVAGEITAGEGPEGRGVDVAFVCVLDEQHRAVVQALAPLGIHVMCEKPLATTLGDCLGIYGTLLREWERLGRKTIFGIGHVLRYAPHNVLLRRLVREEGVVGEVMSVEHTEPVGWWHFDHSYVR
jgi:predicted dehydrogenase